MTRWARFLAAACCVAASLGAATVRPGGAAPAAAPEEPINRQGRQLWLRDCAVCHGEDGAGSARGPSLAGVGAAGVDLQVSTGRMPIDDPSEPAERGPVAYEQAEVDALVAYAGNLLDGPPVPAVDLAGADLARGGSLYRTNCASCHQMAGQGGVLMSGVQVPPLDQSTPVQVVAAMRAAPNEMPEFPESFLDEEATRDIAAYVEAITDPGSPAGWSLGDWGPVPEGAAAFVFGLGTLLLVARHLGERSPPPIQETEQR